MCSAGQREFDDIGSAADNFINLSAKGGNGQLPSLNLAEFKEGKCRCFFNRAAASYGWRIIDFMME